MENQGWRAVVGNNASYARLVQDSAQQTAYHKTTGWVTTDDVMKQHGQQAVTKIQNAFHKQIEGAENG